MARARKGGIGRGRLLLVAVAAAATAGMFLLARSGGMDRIQTRLAAAGLLPGADTPAADASPADPAPPGAPADAAPLENGGGGADAKKGNKESPDPNDPEFLDSVVQSAVESMFENGAPSRTVKTGGGAASAAEKGEAPGSGGPGEDGAGKKGREKADAKALAAEASAMTAEAVAAMKAGRFDEAMGLLEKSLALNPANRQAYQTMAALGRQLGLTDQELRAYDRWMEAMPDDALARYLAAQAYTRNGYDQEAIARLREFQAMNSGDLRAYPMAADLYRKLGLRDEEGATLQQWASEAPAAPDARRALGDYYRRMGDYDAALSEYEATAAMTPNDPSAYLQMGNTYRRMGMYEEALAQYETAVSLRPGNMNALSQLAETQRQTGDYAAAIASYERIIAAEPGSPQAANAERSITRMERTLAREAQPGEARPKKPKKS